MENHKEPWCCVIDCAQPAVVRIYDMRSDVHYEEAETHACADHVRELGGEETYTEITRFSDDTETPGVGLKHGEPIKYGKREG